jgi:hypothetical protein
VALEKGGSKQKTAGTGAPVGPQLGTFRALLEAHELSFEDEPALEEALFRWKGVDE